MQFAVSLRSYRRSHRLTQKEIAATFGVSREYYSRLECGKRLPSMKLLERICLATTIPAENIFGRGIGRFSGNEISEMCRLCLKMRKSDRRKIQALIKRLIER